MAGFDVTVGELVSGAAFMTDTHESLAAELNRIAAMVEDVLATSWRGDAASSFGAAWTEWAEGAREAVTALLAMSDSLRATGANYAAAEQASVIAR